MAEGNKDHRPTGRRWWVQSAMLSRPQAPLRESTPRQGRESMPPAAPAVPAAALERLRISPSARL